MTEIGASAERRGLLYALAAKCGETHPHVEDRAATEFALASITELTGD
jgi:hypothetical protein